MAAIVTIKMTQEDLDLIKRTLLQAEINTQTSCAELDKKRIRLANAQIKKVLDHFGWK